MNLFRKIFRWKAEHELFDSFEDNQSCTDLSKMAFVMSIFVFLREFRPIDMYFTAYLTSSPRNFSVTQVNEEIYPMGTFSCFVSTVILLLITDYLRYKPMLTLQACVAIFSYGILIGTPTITTLSIALICSGFFDAAITTSMTYSYAKVNDVTQYQKLTALIRTFALFGRFFSGAFAQITLSMNWLRKDNLVYCSVAGISAPLGMILAAISSLFLPTVAHSIYFHRAEKVIINGEKKQVITVIKSQKFSVVAKRIAYDFKVAYSNYYVTKWSLWWTFAFGIQCLLQTYAQVLWQNVAEEGNGNVVLMNGAVESLSTLLGALATYSVGFVKVDWKANSDLIACITSFIFAILIQFMYSSTLLSVLYALYLVFNSIFLTVFTIAQWEIAKYIEKDSFALVFGFNMSLSLAVGCVITFMFVQGRVIALTTREQFFFYAICFAILGLIFLIRLCWKCGRNLMNSYELL